MDQIQLINVMPKDCTEALDWCHKNLVEDTWDVELVPEVLKHGVIIFPPGDVRIPLQFSFSNPDDAMRFKLIFG